MLDYAQARRTMVDSQLRVFDITDRAVLAAMDEVARELFVPQGREGLAYGDQTMVLSPARNGVAARYMLEPMMVGRMLQALRVEAGSSILDVACGFGYTSALLDKLGAKVTALESLSDVAATARMRLAGTAPDVVVREGPLADGWAETSGYDYVIVNGAVARSPERLLGQLADGGRLVCVLSGGRPGKAVLYIRSGETVGSTTLFDAQVPDLQEFQPEPTFEF